MFTAVRFNCLMLMAVFASSMVLAPMMRWSGRSTWVCPGRQSQNSVMSGVQHEIALMLSWLVRRLAKCHQVALGGLMITPPMVSFRTV